MAKLDVALRRSRNVPLIFSASFGSRDVNFMRIAMARLVVESPRWQHAAFTLHADLQQTMLPALSDLSSLESFSVSLTRCRTRVMYVPAGILDTAPKLRTICLYPLTTIHLPQQLAELNVGPITMQKLLHLLSAAPELRVFRARLSTGGARVLTSLTYTSLQVLLLRLDFLSLSPFKYLTVPSLIHLTCDEVLSMDELDNMSQFLRRLGCRLQFLQFPIRKMNHAGLTGSFQSNAISSPQNIPALHGLCQ
ncbi:uncharacterized protein ARMOST_01324 [Armillaria ostoyae]|uniref:F-box domain-containing protein n=1 Tax=Armillaria ostoyae TaxID=47428 RepID=A0A284QNN4_ARMOS|nr:uncharacterized protein ARMOST_01324 [Armillaria ostoyae]